MTTTSNPPNSPPNFGDGVNKQKTVMDWMEPGFQNFTLSEWRDPAKPVEQRLAYVYVFADMFEPAIPRRYYAVPAILTVLTHTYNLRTTTVALELLGIYPDAARKYWIPRDLELVYAYAKTPPTPHDTFRGVAVRRWRDGVFKNIREIRHYLDLSESLTNEYIEERAIIKFADGTYRRRISPDQVDYRATRPPKEPKVNGRTVLIDGINDGERFKSSRQAAEYAEISRARAAAILKEIACIGPEGHYILNENAHVD